MLNYRKLKSLFIKQNLPLRKKIQLWWGPTRGSILLILSQRKITYIFLIPKKMR